MPRTLLLLMVALLPPYADPRCGAAFANQISAAASAAGATVAPQKGAGAGLKRVFPALTFNRPTDLQASPDGSRRLFVLEKTGRIKVFRNQPDVKVARVFLDLRGKVASAASEMGLLGLAFHPKFASNRYFYVNYTADGPRRTVVSRFKARADRPDEADPASEHVILTFRQPYDNHNGGQLAFGPDGHLYISTGDGGSNGPPDPHGNGQKKTTLLGKLLRIDVDRRAAGKRYGIPADNPFAKGGGSPEIFAWGFRNLWRFSFDRETGRIWGADVGRRQREEVDLIQKGRNYGWSVMEGSLCFQNPGCAKRYFEPPVTEYAHDQGLSITGGYVYRGARVPALVGDYVYGDYVTGKVWALRYDGKTGTPRLLVDSDLNPASFGIDADRELYLVDHGKGGLWQFR